MSSPHTNPSSRSPLAPSYSVFDADPSAVPYPTVPKIRRDGKMGLGRVCEICSNVIGLGTNGALHPYNTHVLSCRNKHRKYISRPSGQATSPVPAPSTTAASSRSDRSPSLSPLVIGGHLHASLSPDLSPSNSPTSPLTSAFFDVGSDVDIRLPSPVQSIAAHTNPLISINPPSDDTPSSTMILHSPQSHQAAPNACTGVLVQWTPGTIWETYPFPSHSFVEHPWDIIEFCPPSHLYLRSKACTGAISAGGYDSICHQCLWIPSCDAYKTIQKRAHNAPPHTPHHLLAFHQLSGIPKTLRKMLNEARLKVTEISEITIVFYLQHVQNAALSRKLSTKQRNVNDYQRLLKILASNDVKRLKCVLGVALKCGCSVSAIIIRIEQAVNGLYAAWGNYSERELDIAFLAKSLGGPKLLYALCHSHGLPAYRTISNHRVIPRLAPSGSIPTADEISSNITSFFSTEQRPQLSRCGHSLLIDGVAVDERGCYDRETNEVVGFCREHGAGVDRRITGMAAVEYLADLVHGENPTLHFGSEASVVAIAAHREDNYQAIPLVVSTKCGTETGEDCANWLRRVVTAWELNQYGAGHNGPIWSVGSDGEASLRNSRFQLCMDRKVQKSSPLGLKLSRLLGMNLQTGVGDITMTADYKHAFKRTYLFQKSVLYLY